MSEQAKQQAIQDIKEELAKANKCFLAFHSNLNPVMEQLVDEQLKLQTNLNNPSL